MKTRIITIFLSVISVVAYSQNDYEALRYSQTSLNGTARFVGVAGAYGAVGADISTLNFNPAGIALFRNSEITFTPSFVFSKNNTDFENNLTTTIKRNFSFNNFGFVITTKPDNINSLFKSFNYGFSLNKLNSFTNNVKIEGQNTSNSFLMQYVNSARGLRLNELNDFTNGLAYDAGLIYMNDTVNFNYNCDMPLGDVYQEKHIKTSGYINELAFSTGANYADKLYFGLTLGFSILKYDETVSFYEKDNKNLNSFYVSGKRIDYLQTTGNGINLKAGAIYRANNWVRLGLAIHTPTLYYSMNDDWEAEMKGHYTNIKGGDSIVSAKSPKGRNEYELYTPMKLIGSAAFIIGKSGFISVDYEHINYSKASFYSDKYGYSSENKSIEQNFKSAGNLKIGAEWRYNIFNIRAGYALNINPYKEGAPADVNNYTFGLGIRNNNYYIDFAWVYSKQKDEGAFYSNAPITKYTYNKNSYFLTLGFKM